MNKFLIILGLLCLPFLAAAQWSVNLNGGAGFAKEIMKQTIQIPPDNTKNPYEGYTITGHSFSAGVEVQYLFTPRVGMASGLTYFYAKSPNEYLITLTQPKEWHSESISIPFSLLWMLGSGYSSTIRLGFSTHFNLLKYSTDHESQNTAAYNSVFLSVHAGYFYRLSSRFQLGIMFSRDVTAFLKKSEENVYIQDVADAANLISKHYFFTTQLSVRYRLFSGHLLK